MYVHTSAATEKTKVYIKTGNNYSWHAVLISNLGCGEACPELCKSKWSFNPKLFSNGYACLNLPFGYNCHNEADNSLKLTCSKKKCFYSYNKYFT